MRTQFLAIAMFAFVPTIASGQHMPSDRTPPGAQAQIDSQARTMPGTVTSPNPENAAIAKIDAAGKNPSTKLPNDNVTDQKSAATAENNSGDR